MISRKKFGSIAALMLLFSATGETVACAAQWTIIPESSSIAFSGTQMGQPLVGRFSRFSGEIDFEPGAVPKGNVRIDIDMTSIETGADDRDAMALGNDWFVADRMPKAMFTANAFTQLSPDTYEADGQLTIHGITVPIALPFTLNVNSKGMAEMKGQASLDRLKFDLGTGQFKDPAVVSQNIQVEILVHAQRD